MSATWRKASNLHFMQKKWIRVLFPEGSTKYIQAPDISWNKPFKALATEIYDKWLAEEEIKQETPDRKFKPPPLGLLLTGTWTHVRK